jgi:hypothetical protein
MLHWVLVQMISGLTKIYFYLEIQSFYNLFLRKLMILYKGEVSVMVKFNRN